jgi:hypothetical protein
MAILVYCFWYKGICNINAVIHIRPCVCTAVLLRFAFLISHSTKCNLCNIAHEREVIHLVFSPGIYFFSLLIVLISGEDEFTQVLSCTGMVFRC